MKAILSLLTVAGVLLSLTPALGQTNEATDCWSETIYEDLAPVTVTVCLLEGGSIQVFTAGTDPPRMIDVNLGYDFLGTECWWSTAYDTAWVKLDQYTDDSIRVGYRPEGSGGTILDAIVRPCQGQPRETETVLSQAWELADRHIHEEPEPSFNPDTGITGFETYIAVDVPDPINDSLISPLGTVVEVEIKVGAVIVDWGDGTSDTFTESAYSLLTDWPTGKATHIYETKTCTPPGATPYCHDTLSAYPITVDFDWFVQWRVNAGPWSPILVPNTTAAIGYDVGEIVTRTVPNP